MNILQPWQILKWPWRGILAFALVGGPALAGEVNIAPGVPFVEFSVNGVTHRIERIQDTENMLTDSFAKTSRPCPEFCIHPMSAAPGVETVGELELLDFLRKEAATGGGVLIDARIRSWYLKGTIPGAVNIPFTLLSAEDNPFLPRILQVLGARRDGPSGWDFGHARKLMVFCNGPWCDQSPRAIKNLIAAGYPPEKLFYYRGGLQEWQILGLNLFTPDSDTTASAQ